MPILNLTVERKPNNAIMKSTTRALQSRRLDSVQRLCHSLFAAFGEV